MLFFFAPTNIKNCNQNNFDCLAPNSMLLWCRENVVAKMLQKVRRASILRVVDQFDEIIISTISYYLFLEEFTQNARFVIQQIHFQHFYRLMHHKHLFNLELCIQHIQMNDAWLHFWMQKNFLEQKWVDETVILFRLSPQTFCMHGIFAEKIDDEVN